MDIIRISLAGVSAVALLFIVRQTARIWHRPQHPGTLRVLVFVAVLSVSAVIISVALLLVFPDGQEFAAFGIAKKVTLPIAYSAAAIVLTLPGPRGRPALRFPLFWLGMWTLLIVGFSHTFFWSSQAPILDATVEGTLLFAGFLLFFLVGSTSGDWDEQDLSVFLILLSVVTVIAVYSGFALASLVALTTPLGFGLVLWAIQARHNRAAWLIAGLAFASSDAISLLADPDSSIAALSQLGVCAALLVLVTLPRLVRLVVWSLSIPATAIGLVLSPIWPLMIGQWRGESDVTLAHRGFETAAVLDLILRSPASTLFGMGPGGYVDLTGSPDAQTLLASGRYLPAVDDVHLLTSWLLLKGGVLGLAAFMGFIVFLIVSTFKHIGDPTPRAFDTLLLMLIWSGIAMALPAATHVFANPLPALAAGLLLARQCSRSQKLLPQGRFVALRI